MRYILLALKFYPLLILLRTVVHIKRYSETDSSTTANVQSVTFGIGSKQHDQEGCVIGPYPFPIHHFQRDLYWNSTVPDSLQFY